MAMASGFMCYITQDDVQKGVICSMYTHNVWNEDLTSHNINLTFDIADNLSMRYLAFAITQNGYEWEVLHIQDRQNNVSSSVIIPEHYLGSVKFGIKLYDTPPTAGSVLHVGFDYVINGGIDLISQDGTEIIELSCDTEGADIRYTTDGNDPTENSSLYSGRFNVNAPVTVKARGYKDGMLASDIAELHIEEPPKLQTPTLSLSRSGSTVSGTIGNTVSGATYRYRVGSAPSSETDGTAISGTTFSFTNSSAVTVYVKGFMDGHLPSDAVSDSVSQYVPTLQTPTLSLSRSGSTVSGTVGNRVSGATYRYKVNSIPTSSSDGSAVSSSGTFSFTNSSSLTVYVVGFMSGYNPSNAASDYVGSYTPTCATPSISQSGNTVTFSCSTSGATIHYSGCGKSGTCSSGGSVSIAQSGTMTAYATKSGYSSSSTASKYCSYTAPTPSLPTPTVTLRTSRSDSSSNNEYILTLTNAGSFPSGTTISGSLSALTYGTSRYTQSFNVTVNSSGSIQLVRFYAPFSETTNVATGTFTVTASKSGYKSSSLSKTNVSGGSY